MTTATFSSFLLSALGEDAGRLADRLRRAVVAVQGPRGGGSGTVWRPGGLPYGLVVTNHHVVAQGRAQIETDDGRRVAAEVVRSDPSVDLSLLRVPALDLQPVEVGDSSALRVGQLVLAVGNPWGRRGVVTAGIILATHADTGENRAPLANAIRADVGLAPGNSGGPLADASGRVIGINAMISGGMAIAVPSSTVEAFVSEAALPRGLIGISGRPVPAPAAWRPEWLGDDGEGLLMLTDIAPGSPAEQAGLLPGDFVVGMDGVRGGAETIFSRFQRIAAGRSVRLEILRGGVVREFDAIPVEAV